MHYTHVHGTPIVPISLTCVELCVEDEQGQCVCSRWRGRPRGAVCTGCGGRGPALRLGGSGSAPLDLAYESIAYKYVSLCVYVYI